MDKNNLKSKKKKEEKELLLKNKVEDTAALKEVVEYIDEETELIKDVSSRKNLTKND
jgi:hypothetical protein